MMQGQDNLSAFFNFISYFAVFLLTCFEFLTAIGFVIVFYCLFRELKKVLATHKYSKIKYRTATYLSLISILNISRFFYFGVIALTYRLVDANEERMLECKDLVPSYLTEIFFCLFVIFHVFIEGKSKDADKVKTSSASQHQIQHHQVASQAQNATDIGHSLTGDGLVAHAANSAMVAVAIESDTTIPVYIVKDADCLGHNKDKQEDSVVMKLSVSPTTNTVLRYSSLQDSEDVLLV